MFREMFNEHDYDEDDWWLPLRNDPLYMGRITSASDANRRKITWRNHVSKCLRWRVDHVDRGYPEQATWEALPGAQRSLDTRITSLPDEHDVRSWCFRRGPYPLY